jgi:negative regulator of replication initiation
MGGLAKQLKNILAEGVEEVEVDDELHERLASFNLRVSGSLGGLVKRMKIINDAMNQADMAVQLVAKGQDKRKNVKDIVSAMNRVKQASAMAFADARDAEMDILGESSDVDDDSLDGNQG